MSLRKTLFIFILNALCFSAPDSAAAPVKIGVIVAQSGPLAPIGVTLQNAIRLAASKLAPSKDVEFVFEDDGFLPKNAVSAAQKLLLDPAVKALITFGGSTSQAVAKLTVPRGIPIAALTILDSITLGNDSVFQLFVTASEMNRRTEEEIIRRGFKTLAIVSTQHDATLFQRDDFLKIAESRVLLSEELLPGDLDARTVVSKIKALNPDAVFIIMLPPQGSAFTKQLRQSGYQGQLVVSLQLGAPSEIKNAEGATIGAFYACGDDRNAAGFYSDYALAFPGSQPFSETVFAYDAAQLMIHAARSGDIARYLRNVQHFSGALGDFSARGRNVFTFSAAVKEITASGSRFLQH